MFKIAEKNQLINLQNLQKLWRDGPRTWGRLLQVPEFFKT